MNLDLELSEAMERRLIARAQRGPNADKPVAERAIPRASVLSQGCGRRVYYWLTGAPEGPLDALGACAFQDGKDFEAGILEDFLLGSRYDVAEEQGPAVTDWFTGQPDLVVRRGDGGLSIVDAKSANPASFAMTIKKNAVSDSYVAQLSLYAYALGADECIVLYRKKGGTRKEGAQVYAAFRFAPDLALVERLHDMAEEAMQARDVGLPIPARAYPKSAWNCAYCSFQEHCWKGA